MSPEKQRRTFLSYSRENKDFALALAKELKSEGFDVWLDQLDIPLGARWDREVEKALKASEIFMIILTTASVDSENVLDEIGYAIDAHKRFLPILLEECEVPLRLRRFQYVDFTNKSFDEGVKAAKELLRGLIDQPTLPRRTVVRDVHADADHKAKEEAEQNAAEKAARVKAEREATEKSVRERAEREAAEGAAKEKSEREAAENVAREKAERETAERAAKEKAEREAAEKAAKEKAEREAAEKAAREKALKEAAEKAYREELARLERERIARENEKQEAYDDVVQSKNKLIFSLIMHFFLGAGLFITKSNSFRKWLYPLALVFVLIGFFDLDYALGGDIMDDDTALLLGLIGFLVYLYGFVDVWRTSGRQVRFFQIFTLEGAKRQAPRTSSYKKDEAPKSTFAGSPPFLLSWKGRMLLGGIVGLILGIILLDYYTIAPMLILLVVCGVAGLITYPHKLSIVFPILGFIVAGFIYDPGLYYPEDFIFVGALLGIPAGALLSRILHWIRILK